MVVSDVLHINSTFIIENAECHHVKRKFGVNVAQIFRHFEPNSFYILLGVYQTCNFAYQC